MSVSAAAIDVSANVSESAPAPVVIQVSVTNPPATALAYSLTTSGSAVGSAKFTWQSPATGQLTVSFPSPAGTATYSGTVQLAVCTDSACNDSITGSPADIPVSYTVLPTPSFTLTPVGIGFQADTAITSPETTTFVLDVKNVPTAGLYVLLTQPKSGFITAVTDTEEPLSDGSISVDLMMTLASPASLGSGYFSSSFTFQLCFDQACTQPVPGSPITEPINYTVVLTQGKEYTLQALNDGGISDLAYDSADQNIYVSGLSGYNSSFSGAVTQINPTTGAIGTQVTFSDSLARLAAADDGSFLYVGSAANPAIYRLQLPSLAASLDIPLGTASDGNPNIAAQMAVAPGAPQTVAVALGQPSSVHTSGTEILDNAVSRPSILAALGYYAQPDAIAWSGNAALLYAYRYSSEIPFDEEIDQVSVNSSGLSVQSSTSLTGGPDSVTRILYAQGLIYDYGGYVYNASTGALVGQFVMPGGATPPANQIIAMVPDVVNGHAFFLVHNSQQSHLLLFAFDLTTFALQSIIDLGYDNFDVALATNMILWGSNGVAFNRGGLQMLAGTFLAPPVTNAAKRAARRSVKTLHIVPRAQHSR
jgi:hypothetical protein